MHQLHLCASPELSIPGLSSTRCASSWLHGARDDVRNHEGSCKIHSDLQPPSSTASVDSATTSDLVILLYAFSKPTTLPAHSTSSTTLTSRATFGQWTPIQPTRKISDANATSSPSARQLRSTDPVHPMDRHAVSNATTLVANRSLTHRRTTGHPGESASRLAKGCSSPPRLTLGSRPSGHAARQLPAHADLALRPKTPARQWRPMQWGGYRRNNTSYHD
jgi:hypothetical protein